MVPKKRPPAKRTARRRRPRREPKDRNILNAAQAAEALGVTERLVVRLAREGKIPAQKIGREWRFSRQGMTSYLSGESIDVVERVLSKRGVKVTVKK